MEQRDTIEVAELLARLATAEQEAAENGARAAALAEDVRGERRFAQGEVSALRGVQKLVREMAGWPVEQRPLMDWPGGDGPASG